MEVVVRQRHRGEPDPLPRLADHFGIVLLLVLVTLCAQALIDVRGSAIGALATHAVSGLALIFAVRAGAAPRRWRRAADVLVVATLLANLVIALSQVFSDTPRADLSGELLWLIAACIVPYVVARRLVQHPVVTVQTVMGAIAAYLQIAIAYASLFQFVDVVGSEPFFGHVVPTTRYTYVSLQTISTLGIGDLTAASDLGRLLVVSEAVVGQVYLVTFVALIVSRFASRGPMEPASPAGPTPEPGPRAGRS
jgi:hypothetical protein